MATLSLNKVITTISKYTIIHLHMGEMLQPAMLQNVTKNLLGHGPAWLPAVIGQQGITQRGDVHQALQATIPSRWCRASQPSIDSK